MAGRLTDRVAVMTGESAGIGRGTAREIARKPASEGADIAVADISPAEETRALVEANRATVLQCEGRHVRRAQVNALAGEVRDAPGPVDILVNRAAIVSPAEFDNATFERWRHTFAVNADGPFLTAKAHNPAAVWAGHDATVNAVAPSPTQTATTLQAVSEQFFDQAVRMQVLKRRGEPEDIADTVVCLASDEDALITGRVSVVVGGITRR